MCTTVNPLLLCPAHFNHDSCSMGGNKHTPESLCSSLVLLSVTHCSYRVRPAIQFPDLHHYQQSHTQHSPLSAYSVLSNSPTVCWYQHLFPFWCLGQYRSSVSRIGLTSFRPSTNTTFVTKDGVSYYVRQLSQPLLHLLLLFKLSSLLSPLCTVCTTTYLKQTTFLQYIQCCSCSVFTVCATCNVISTVKYVLHFYISTSRSLCVQCPIWLFFCSSLISCFPGTLLRYCLSDFEMVPAAPNITGITFAFTFHMRWISVTRSLYYKIFSASLLVTFLSPELQHLLTCTFLVYCHWLWCPVYCQE